MGKKGNAVSTQVLKSKELTVTPTRVRLRLRTVWDCRRELAKLYVEARAGAIETSSATRLAYLLISLANLIRDTELEERIATLESQANNK